MSRRWGASAAVFGALMSSNMLGITASKNLVKEKLDPVRLRAIMSWVLCLCVLKRNSPIESSCDEALINDQLGLPRLWVSAKRLSCRSPGAKSFLARAIYGEPWDAAVA